MPLLRRVTNLFRRSRLDREIAAEMEAHIEMRAADSVAAGMSREEARRDALVRFGNRTATRERTADADAALNVESVVRDLTFALRQLRNSPGFAATAIVILALGIGASTAIFSAVNPILFEPLPYPHAERIMTIWDSFKYDRLETTFGTFRELAERSRSFESLATFEPWQPVMTGAEKPERPDGQRVSASYFHMLGVQPALGRDFQPADDVFRGPHVVILSDRLWRRRFTADPGIPGKQIKLNDNNYTVIGVMPKDFENVLLPSAEIWTPLQYDLSSLNDFNTSAWGHHLRIAGRLRAGVSPEEARRELDRIAHHPIQQFARPPWASLHSGFIVASLQEDTVRGVKPALLAVLGAVTLVLLIACVNVTSLLLGRGVQRQGEFAMRATLGAGKARLIRQLLTESLLLALLGGTLGIVVAEMGVKVLIALSPPGLPRVNAVVLDAPVFVFAFSIAALVGLAAGLIPALQTPRINLQTGLQQGARTMAGGRQGARRTLVVSEVALALMLLIAAGLLLRSMERLLSVDPGFSTDHVLTMQVQTAGHKFDDLASAPGAGDAVRRRFFWQALDEVRRVPGVTTAGFTSLLPLSDDPSWIALYGAHFENDVSDRAHQVFRYAVSPGYFEALGIPLLRGRFLDAHDLASAPHVALISESLARRQFPRQDAIGKRVHFAGRDVPDFTIVGIVGDVRQTSLALDEPDAVYLSTEQTWFADDALSLVVRAQGDAAALAPAVRNAVWRVDKDEPILRVVTMSKLRESSVAQRRFVLILFEAFSLVALVLAATGIYGLLSSSVAERTREIGVRTALGASRADILALVMRQGLMLTALGLAIGLVAAMLASGALAALLFGVSRLDPLTYAGVTLLLLAVSAIACFVPGRRAASIDPMQALRSE
ncbi:MAG: ABC transporter permease [Terracidiphilus sp.]